MGTSFQVMVLLANCATSLGFLWAIFLFIKEKKKGREEAEIRAYHTVDDKFLTFLEICSRNTQLHCFLNSDDTIKLDEHDKLARQNIYEVLICVFERAHVFYDKEVRWNKSHQWRGWEMYISQWFKKESFKETWFKINNTYDEKFVKYMDKILGETKVDNEPKSQGPK